MGVRMFFGGGHENGASLRGAEPLVEVSCPPRRAFNCGRSLKHAGGVRPINENRNAVLAAEIHDLLHGNHQCGRAGDLVDDGQFRARGDRSVHCVDDVAWATDRQRDLRFNKMGTSGMGKMPDRLLDCSVAMIQGNDLIVTVDSGVPEYGIDGSSGIDDKARPLSGCTKKLPHHVGGSTHRVAAAAAEPFDGACFERGTPFLGNPMNFMGNGAEGSVV